MIICLKNLAQNHSIAILTSIHQPNNDIVNLFDQLYVLTSRGQCIYNGHPSKLRKFLLNFQIEMLDYQVPIEELIKISITSNINNIQTNNLMCIEFENKLNASFQEESKSSHYLEHKMVSFSLTDLSILLRRTIKNDLIGGWHLQLTVSICYFCSLILILYLFPNDIGIDAGCTEERIDLRNISLINERILNSFTGKEQKFQQNAKFILLIMLNLYLFNVILFVYVFLCEFQVAILFSNFSSF